MINECNCWLKGLIEGDGYTDERHLEIFNSSESILKETIIKLKGLVPETRIKVDIYSESPTEDLIIRWSESLELPSENFTLRKNTSPWKARTEKIRVRVSSKELVNILSSAPKHEGTYLRGLFDAEASVDIKGYVEFKQKANENGTRLVKRVSKILETLGIESTDVKTKNDRNIKRDAYLYVKDLMKFKDKIGFIDKTKMLKLEVIISAKKENNMPLLEGVQRLISLDKGLWDIINELRSPYHKVRQLLKDNHLAVRQTR